MSVGRQASISALAVAAQESAARVLSFLVTALLARYLGPSQFGEYSFALTYIMLFSLVADFGVATVAVREISMSRQRASTLLGNAILIKCGLAMVAFALALMTAMLSSYQASTKWLLGLMSVSIFTFSTGGFGAIYVAVFSIRLARTYVTALDCVLRLSIFMAALGVTWARGSLVSFVSLSVAMQIVAMWVLARRATTIMRPDYKLDWQICRMLLRESLPIAIMSVFATLYFRLDVLFLAHWQDMAAVGVYSAAYRVSEVLTIGGAALVATLLPVASTMIVNDPARFRRLLRHSVRGIALVMIPVCTLVTGYSVVIVRLLYSDEYTASAKALGILTWAAPLMVFGSLNYVVQVSTHRQWLLTWLTMLMLATNVVLGLLLIPRLSFIGASVATVLTEFAGFLVVLYWWLREHRYAFPLSLLWIIPTALMFGGIVWLSRELPVQFGLALCAVSYPVLLLVFRCVSIAELLELRTLLRTALARS